MRPRSFKALCQAHNKQLQRTGTRRRGRAARAPFHYARASRSNGTARPLNCGVMCLGSLAPATCPSNEATIRRGALDRSHHLLRPVILRSLSWRAFRALLVGHAIGDGDWRRAVGRRRRCERMAHRMAGAVRFGWCHRPCRACPPPRSVIRPRAVSASVEVNGDNGVSRPGHLGSAQFVRRGPPRGSRFALGLLGTARYRFCSPTVFGPGGLVAAAKRGE